MTFVAFSDSTEKVLPELTPSERRAVNTVRSQLEAQPRLGKRRPGYDPKAEDYVVRLGEEQTGGRTISVLYRFHPSMDAALVTWLVIGP
ncbi:hypothetical protein LN042_23330 [Kitasatospora sp. RB6PN24]|uniref:hypothetical protein n=1 Tax=Kitasatospora humi TaxID=2893891 RepID=UPI001E4B4D0B|nr:hypothetical protein [Kitasatospora humi]MCC9309970.1 hypothetical protein [Kitasatospora humi]